jgi:Amidohydrolase family
MLSEALDLVIGVQAQTRKLKRDETMWAQLFSGFHPDRGGAKDHLAIRASRVLTTLMIGSVASLFHIALASAADMPTDLPELVLDGVTVVNAHDGTLTANQRITINAGRITSIGTTGDLSEGRSAGSIDARGKFVVPGYVDMHIHVLESSNPASSFALMLAHGITGFRQMTGSPELLKRRRDGTLGVGHDAPALLAMPGTILTPFNARSPDDAVAEVQRQKDLGADFIKVIEVNPPTFFAAQAKAESLGLPFVGHLPATVNVLAASEGGMKSIEHLGPRDSILVACSTDEAALRNETREANARSWLAWLNPTLTKILGKVFMPVITKFLQKAVVNPMLMAGPSEFEHLQRVIDTYSDAKCRQLATKLAANQTWQVPTLIRLRTMEFGDVPEYRNDPHLRYMPAATVALWDEVAQEFSNKIPPASRATLAALYSLQLKLVKLFEETGVKMLAGDDSGQWLVPGFGLHQEFDQLEQAGLSPLTVLQMATINAAEFLERTSIMGRVSPGMDADLVLLDANPIESVQNLHKISAVIRAGAYYSRGDLDKLTETALKNPSP